MCEKLVDESDEGVTVVGVVGVVLVVSLAEGAGASCWLSGVAGEAEELFPARGASTSMLVVVGDGTVAGDDGDAIKEQMLLPYSPAFAMDLLLMRFPLSQTSRRLPRMDRSRSISPTSERQFSLISRRSRFGKMRSRLERPVSLFPLKDSALTEGSTISTSSGRTSSVMRQ